MAHIQKIKLKKGTAHRVYYSINNKPYKQYFPVGTSQTVIKAFIADIESKKLNSKLNNNNSGIQLSVTPAPTLAKLKIIYLKKRANEIDPDRALYALDSLMKYLGPQIPINQITRNEMHHYRDTLLQDRLAAIHPDPEKIPYNKVQKIRRGVNKELGELRVVFNWSYKQDLVNFKVFDKVTFLKADQSQPDTLTRAEEKRLYNALPKNDLRLAYYILRFTGIRRGELMRLKYKNIDLANRLIYLERTKNRTLDSVPIHPKLLRILKWVRLDQNDPDDIIFPHSRWWVSQGISRALKKTCIEKHSSAHLIRHTFGRRVIESNQSDFDKGERLAQELLRHKEKRMTQLYTKIVKGYLIEESAKLDL